MTADVIFTPLQFRNLTVKNRVFRSNISGRFDNYDGSGNQARINWELKFARGGAGAIISSFVPVTIRGRIMPNYATIHSDERIAFWRELGRQVHEHDCRFIMQLSHAGRQRDIGGIEFEKGLSSTDNPEPLNGFECERMTLAQIAETVAVFAAGARRARQAGLDGVELHGANGYLITQFLSSAINDRSDEYGGTLRNRARFVIEIVEAIRREVGRDFHVQVKISATEYNNALTPFEGQGNTINDSVRVVKWLEEAGTDAIHVSSGSSFPHPKNPPGEFPIAEALQTFDTMISSGRDVLRNYLLLKNPVTARLYKDAWNRARGDIIEGINLKDSAAIRKAIGIPVLCTGGFQTASIIREAIQRGECDAVSIARPLVANNDLVHMFARGLDRAPRPCTYCNKCLVNVIENPLGCYEESRYDSREQMIAEIMSVFEPAPFTSRAAHTGGGQ
ncbi:MAG TPA: NADH:flavin oxidoreductase [Bryobacteraceae bacterium]|nr:NADH:flavin oxidoreductase [Bryobacteraceae bacterium]